MKHIIVLLTWSLLTTACYSSKTIAKSSFSSRELALIKYADNFKPMRVYKINNTNDSLLLRKKSNYINPKDPNLQHFVQRLYATVRDSTSMGIGIAAPQVGILKNIIWVQRFDKNNLPFEVYLNPIISSYSNKKQTLKEGCLSIPNRKEVLKTRSDSVTIEYDTMKGLHKIETIKG